MSLLSDDPELRFYIVFLEGGGEDLALREQHDVKQLAPGLFLVVTTLTQSRLYHAIKRQARANSLLVGKLASAPKFKGMSEGALKWIRALGV